jgi:hypothetical protein
MARLYADEDVPHAVAVLLQALGHDVLTTTAAGQGGAGDCVQLQFATGEKRAIITHNRADYFRLHRASAAHEGIIACTRDSNSQALATRTDQAIQTTGQCIRVNRPSAPRPPGTGTP